MKFLYVPILETLKCMCQNTTVCRLIRESSERQTSYDYKDFCDGSYFKAHPLFSKHSTALQKQLYYDDFETTNPLGSKRGIHIVGALYFVIKRNLPTKLYSTLINIHLVALFHVHDLKEYGFQPIMEPLIHDIRILENLWRMALNCQFLQRKFMALCVK